jgi:hypothetical protein
MNNAKTTTATPPELLDDMNVVAEALAAGGPVPAEVARRVRERSEKVQEQLLRKYGVRQIAVDLIRQGRGP